MSRGAPPEGAILAGEEFSAFGPPAGAIPVGPEDRQARRPKFKLPSLDEERLKQLEKRLRSQRILARLITHPMGPPGALAEDLAKGVVRGGLFVAQAPVEGHAAYGTFGRKIAEIGIEAFGFEGFFEGCVGG